MQEGVNPRSGATIQGIQAYWGEQTKGWVDSLAGGTKGDPGIEPHQIRIHPKMRIPKASSH